MKITEKTVNAITGEETFIEREETETEVEQRSIVEARNAAFILQEKERNDKRQVVLDKLGLTADDVAALFD